MNSGIETSGRVMAQRVAALASLVLLALCLPGAASAQWSAPDAQGNITTGNNVGIGTTPANPEGWAKLLEVFGTPHARFSIRTPNIDARVMTHEYGWWGAPAGMVVGTQTNHALSFGTAAASRMTIGNTGNVGIGTTAPAERLEVRGNVILEAGTNPNLYTGTGAGELNRYLYLLNSPTLTSASGLKAGGVLVSDDYGFANPAKNDLVVKGRIGIGMSAPAYKLDVAGQIRSTSGGFVFPDGTTQTTAAGGSAASISAGQFGQNTGGGNFSFAANVGIGTTTPVAKLDVRGYAVLEAGGNPYLYTGTGTGELNRYLYLLNSPGYQSATGLKVGGVLISDDYGFGNPAKNDLVVKGSVGIGTTTPASKLHVVGDVTVTGNINAKYQDVAEWVPTTQKLAAGTVVVLDTAELNHVLASSKSYDTGVAGVISAQPGISLGEAGEGKVLVATTGRVKVKVDATRAAIKVGDLLVTSDVPGVAMKSQPLDLSGVAIHRPGTLIGKALEPLASGTGEILVLLSLQ